MTANILLHGESRAAAWFALEPIGTFRENEGYGSSSSRPVPRRRTFYDRCCG